MAIGLVFLGKTKNHYFRLIYMKWCIFSSIDVEEQFTPTFSFLLQSFPHLLLILKKKTVYRNQLSVGDETRQLQESA